MTWAAMDNYCQQMQPLSIEFMVLACWTYAAAATLARARCIVLERERHAGWLKELIEGQR